MRAEVESMAGESIAKNASVEVYQVTNGFLVKLPTTRGDYAPIEAAMVFQSFAALSDWMARHFSHRNTGVPNDA